MKDHRLSVGGKILASSLPLTARKVFCRKCLSLLDKIISVFVDSEGQQLFSWLNGQPFHLFHSFCFLYPSQLPLDVFLTLQSILNTLLDKTGSFTPIEK